VVDDEPQICDSLKLLLEPLGYDAETAVAFDEAIQKSAQRTPDLLIVDWMLADTRDGVDLIEILRTTHANLPAIVITGFASEELEDRIDTMESVWLAHKPCPPNEFKQLIADVLRLQMESV
jgi:DNA-binding response OmpR family regulator